MLAGPASDSLIGSRYRFRYRASAPVRRRAPNKPNVRIRDATSVLLGHHRLSRARPYGIFSQACPATHVHPMRRYLRYPRRAVCSALAAPLMHCHMALTRGPLRRPHGWYGFRRYSPSALIIPAPIQWIGARAPRLPYRRPPPESCLMRPYRSGPLPAHGVSDSDSAPLYLSAWAWFRGPCPHIQSIGPSGQAGDSFRPQSLRTPRRPRSHAIRGAPGPCADDPDGPSPLAAMPGSPPAIHRSTFQMMQGVPCGAAWPHFTGEAKGLVHRPL